MHFQPSEFIYLDRLFGLHEEINLCILPRMNYHWRILLFYSGLEVQTYWRVIPKDLLMLCLILIVWKHLTHSLKLMHIQLVSDFSSRIWRIEKSCSQLFAYVKFILVLLFISLTILIWLMEIRHAVLYLDCYESWVAYICLAFSLFVILGKFTTL